MALDKLAIAYLSQEDGLVLPISTKNYLCCMKKISMFDITDNTLTATFTDVRRFGEARPQDLKHFECVAFRGVQLGTNQLNIAKETQHLPQLDVEDAVESTGEFLAIFHNNRFPNQYLVMTDPWGFQPLFFSDPSPAGFSVSTDPSELGYLLNSPSGEPVVDWPAFYLQIGTENSWASTLNTDRTVRSGVRVLRPFEFLYIEDGSVSQVSLRDLLNLERMSYEQLIERGVSNAKAQLKTLIEQGDFEDYRINLSGGKDSRILMALLSAAGVAERFSVRSVNPRTWSSAAARPGLEKDLQIADTIRRRYGMDWFIEAPVTELALDPFEALESWMSYEAGMNFRMPLRQNLRVLPTQIAELRGASGEAFRYFWSHYLSLTPGWQKLQQTTEAFDSDADVMFESLYNSFPVGKSIYREAQKAYSSNLKSMNRPTFSEAVDKHFTLYRNRAHFGTTLRFAREGATPFFLLNQLEFVIAGEKLPSQLRVKGGVFFDIIERLDPQLNDLEFDSKQWDPEIRRRTHRNKIEWGRISTSTELESFYATQGSLAKTTGRSNWNPVFSERSFVANETKDVLRELASLPGAKEVLTHRTITNLINRTYTNPVAGSHNLAKLHNLRRAVLGTKPRSVLRFGVSATQATHDLRYQEPGWSNAFRPSVETILFRVAVNRANSHELEARILLDRTNTFDLEFAFYLKQGNQVVGRVPYSSDRNAIFKIPESSQQYIVQGFVRRNRPEPEVFSLYSSPVS